MSDPTIERIRSHPQYAVLRTQRNRLGWILTALMLVVYYGYIALIAFDRDFLARPLANGVTTVGIPIALGVIVFTVLIVGFYVWRANSTFDALTAQVLDEATR